MTKKTSGETPTRTAPKKAPNAKAVHPKKTSVGAHGSGGRPKGDEHGARWPGGGRKGEDE